MILKDLYCDACGNVLEDVPMKNMDESFRKCYCSTCQGPRIHYVRAVGGAKSRYRFCDWDGASGHVQWLGDTVAEYGEDGPVDTNKAGEEIRGTEDRTAELRDRVEFKQAPTISVG